MMVGQDYPMPNKVANLHTFQLGENMLLQLSKGKIVKKLNPEEI